MKKLLALCLVCMLSGCYIPRNSEATAEQGPRWSPSFSEFSDIPVAPNASMNLKLTHIFGESNNWTGTLVYSSIDPMSEMYDFYKQEMPKFGWSEVLSVRSKMSVMTYTNKERAALVQMEPNTISGTTVTFTVGLKSSVK
ncbi:MAG: hypothetical protein MJ250_02175 [Alphaproteobacteria bacterium]|nr:hypothetical protein [Alphaproteobacteria bacterium]